MSPIAANLQAVRRRISEALQGDSRAITLVAVSKSQPAESVRAAHAAGCRDFGESYVQEALPKLAALSDLQAAWHYIGHLQTNKARAIRFSTLEALCRELGCQPGELLEWTPDAADRDDTNIEKI